MCVCVCVTDNVYIYIYIRILCMYVPSIEQEVVTKNALAENEGKWKSVSF